MALFVRLCPRALLRLHGVRSFSMTQCCKKVTIQPVAYKPPNIESHDEKNMRLLRPQSPHMTIYKFPLPAILSITHRFTGIALGGYMAALGTTSLIINRPMSDFITMLSSNYPNFFILLKLGLIFPLSYHFFNGIRHLVWDSGKSLTLKGVYQSGYLMLLSVIISLGVVIFLWDYGLNLTLKEVYVTGYISLLVSTIVSLVMFCYLGTSKKN